MRYLRVQVDDEHGEAVVYIDEKPSDEALAAVDQVLADMGLTADQLEQMLPVLVRQMHDEQAYERVCAQKGLLL